MPDQIIADEQTADPLTTPTPEWEDPDLTAQAATRAAAVVDLERLVIGSAVTSNDRAEWLLSQLTTAHFTHRLHQEIWAVAADLIGRGDPMSWETVNREITRRRGYTDVKTDLYVTEAANAAPIGVMVSHYVDELRADYKRRRADAVRTRAGKLTHPSRDWHADHAEGIYPLDTIISEFQAIQLDDDQASMSVAGDATEVAEIIESWGMQPAGAFDFGLPDVDAVLNVVPGSLVVIGAYTGVGKSTLASQAARRAVEKGLPAVQFSAEMSVKQLRQRDLCALAGVHLSTTTGNRELTSTDLALLQEWAVKYDHDSTDVGYYLEYVPAMTVNHIRARLSWIKRRHGRIGVVVVDNLQLMRLESGDDNNARTAATTAALKRLAGEMECVILLLSQCRKPDEKGVPRPPTRWDLTGSGAIANDADLVILIHDPCPKSVPSHELSLAAEQRRGEVDLIIAKARSGPEQTSVLADRRHMGYFASGDTEDNDLPSNTGMGADRAAMSPEDRAAGPMPTL